MNAPTLNKLTKFMHQYGDGHYSTVQPTVVPDTHHILFLFRGRYVTTLLFHTIIERKCLEDLKFHCIFSCEYLHCILLLFSTTITSYCNIIPLHVNIPLSPSSKRKYFGKLLLSSSFAYLRIPDDYLDSSVLLASVIWDSCL